MKEEQAFKETLSALLDGEAGRVDQLELRRLARAIDERPELVESYRRYVVARAAMRGEYWPADSKAFLEKLRSSLVDAGMDEATNTSSANTITVQGRQWLPQLGRVAVAASVAVVAVMLMREPPSADKPMESVAAASTEKTPQTITHNTRLVAPEVIAVGTGNHAATTLTGPRLAPVTDNCILGEPQLDQRDSIWEKSLPSGYSLCRQDQQSGRCEPVATAISCYRQ